MNLGRRLAGTHCCWTWLIPRIQVADMRQLPPSSPTSLHTWVSTPLHTRRPTSPREEHCLPQAEESSQLWTQESLSQCWNVCKDIMCECGVRGSYTLRRYSCIYEVCMSPTLNGSSIIWFPHGTAVLNWMCRLLLPLDLFNITVLPANNCSQLVGVIFHWLNSPSWHYCTNLLCLSLPNTYWWQ